MYVCMYVCMYVSVIKVRAVMKGVWDVQVSMRSKSTMKKEVKSEPWVLTKHL